MAKSFAAPGYGTEPPERPDPGILEELKQEAVEDTANAVTDAALKVAAGAKNIVDEAPKAYEAAVEHPIKYGQFTLRSLERYIQHKPFEAMTIFAGLAFALGSFWGLIERERRAPMRVLRYHPERYAMKTFDNTAENASSSYDQRRDAETAMDTVRASASGAVDRASALARDAIADPKRFAQTTVDDVTRYTQEKPLQALAIAAGAAFVIGAMFKR